MIVADPHKRWTVKGMAGAAPLSLRLWSRTAVRALDRYSDLPMDAAKRFGEYPTLRLKAVLNALAD